MGDRVQTMIVQVGNSDWVKYRDLPPTVINKIISTISEMRTEDLPVRIEVR